LGLAWHIWNTRWRPHTPTRGLRAWERGAILVPLGIHGALLYSQIFAAAELRFGFAQALSVMMWLAVLICWVEGVFFRIELVYPMALAAAALLRAAARILLGSNEPGPRLVRVPAAPFLWHACLQPFRGRDVPCAAHFFGRAAPARRAWNVTERRVARGAAARCAALLSLERLVFRLIRRGVCRIDSHLGRRHCLFGVLPRSRHALRHKTLFVVCPGWFSRCCSRALALRLARRTALRWTLTGFIMLMLAYPGSRFVLEVILHRS